MNADREPDFGKLHFAAFRIPVLHGDQHVLAALERVGSILGTRVRCAETRHYSVAEKLVERAAIREDRVFQQGMEATQHRNHLGWLVIFGEMGETDNIGKQYRDFLRANLANGFCLLGQFVDKVWREIAREIGSFGCKGSLMHEQLV